MSVNKRIQRRSYREDGKARENGRRKIVCTFVVSFYMYQQFPQQMYIQICVYHFHGLCRLRDNCDYSYVYNVNNNCKSWQLIDF